MVVLQLEMVVLPSEMVVLPDSSRNMKIMRVYCR
jgi:hypothetical protein